MISHEAIGVDSASGWYGAAVFCMCKGLFFEYFEETVVVVGTLKDLLSVDSTQDGVIDSGVGCIACCSGHLLFILKVGQLPVPLTQTWSMWS